MQARVLYVVREHHSSPFMLCRQVRSTRCASRRGHGGRGKEDKCMQTPIIPIERVSESLIISLIEAGILEISEDGVIKCTEK